MNRQNVLNTLKAHRFELMARYKVRELSLWVLCARYPIRCE